MTACVGFAGSSTAIASSPAGAGGAKDVEASMLARRREGGLGAACEAQRLAERHASRRRAARGVGVDSVESGDLAIAPRAPCLASLSQAGSRQRLEIGIGAERHLLQLRR